MVSQDYRKNCTKLCMLTVLGAEQSKMAGIIITVIVIAGGKCKLVCNSCLQI